MALDDLTPRQLAVRCKRLMRPARGRRGRSLRSICADNAWPYHAVRYRLQTAGLLDTVMAARYEEAGQ